MQITFDIFFAKNLGTIYKDNSVDTDGIDAVVDLDLSQVNYIYVNFEVGAISYSDEVIIKDIENKIVQIPFKTDVLKEGVNKFELVATMKNGDVRPSQTCKYTIEKSLENPNSLQADTKYPILIQLISTVEENIKNIEEVININTNKIDNAILENANKVDAAIAKIPPKEELIGPKGDKGDTGEQGLPGQDGANGVDGKDGITPNIQIGTVTTLEPNQQATVTRKGDNENPIFDFGIPRGQDGISGGSSGTSIDDTTISKDSTWSSEKIEDFVLTNDNVVWTDVSGENLSIDYTKEGYLREIEIWGNTIQNEEDLSDIRHLGELYVGDEGEPILDDLGREQYKIEVESCNESIVGGEFVEGDLTIPMSIKQDSTIYYSSKNSFRFYLNYKDGSNTINSTPILQSNGRYGRSMVVAKDVVSITSQCEGEFVSIKLENNYDYTPHQSNKTTILLPCQLMKVGDVCDRLYWDTEKGKYVVEKNIESFIFDKNDISVQNSAVEGMCHFYSNIDNKYSFVKTKDVTKLCNKFVWNNDAGYLSSIEGFNVLNTSVVRFNIFSSRCSTIEDFKSFLGDDTLIYYVKNSPQLIETNITEQILLPCYKDKTHIFVSGGIDGSIKCKAPLNGGQAILSLSQENKELQSVNQEQDELINISLCATDEMYMMIEPLLVQSVNLSNEGGNNKMVDMYVVMVQRGLKKIEDVPARYREQVIEILNKLEL